MEGREVILFINLIRHKMERGAPAHLKSFVIGLFLSPDLKVRDVAAWLHELNAVV